MNEPLKLLLFPLTDGPPLHLSNYSCSSIILSMGDVTLELAFLWSSNTILLTLIGCLLPRGLLLFCVIEALLPLFRDTRY